MEDVSFLPRAAREELGVFCGVLLPRPHGGRLKFDSPTLKFKESAIKTLEKMYAFFTGFNRSSMFIPRAKIALRRFPNEHSKDGAGAYCATGVCVPASADERGSGYAGYEGYESDDAIRSHWLSPRGSRRQ